MGGKLHSKIINNSGKPLILEFFRTDCKPCINLLNSFKEVYSDWEKKYGVKIIVIVTDKQGKRGKVIKMIKKYNWSFQFYFDNNKSLFHRLTNANILPQTFIFDKDYNLLDKFTGVKPNYGYKIVNGKISNEKVKINKKGKYNKLLCNLINYEKVLESTLKDRSK